MCTDINLSIAHLKGVPIIIISLMSIKKFKNFKMIKKSRKESLRKLIGKNK